ncbi:hypothetical protein [Rhodopirellula sallentina]|uniref:hypothetical protein n=1 Tax=Rhodopirellula sallentina TaxID=1263869 RepID=UPI000694F57E|nr:hypothetical protein [Rhodopirellula sallentina]
MKDVFGLAKEQIAVCESANQCRQHQQYAGKHHWPGQQWRQRTGECLHRVTATGNWYFDPERVEPTEQLPRRLLVGSRGGGSDVGITNGRAITGEVSNFVV